ncbi:actin [Elysia marginata]|uniref:Actin n=1 Tax=Elysia marginata TaxID=1093978 RepID=A0AAV4JUI6_9GAST|nr:actin [Elysia marginata]
MCDDDVAAALVDNDPGICKAGFAPTPSSQGRLPFRRGKAKGPFIAICSGMRRKYFHTACVPYKDLRINRVTFSTLYYRETNCSLPWILKWRTNASQITL